MNKLDEFIECIRDRDYVLGRAVADNIVNLAREIFDDKPTLKPVDLSVLINSRIDCEFKYHEPESFRYKSVEDIKSILSHQCKPRMTPFIHACPNGFDSCPLPEGLKINVYFREFKVMVIHNYNDLDWSHGHGLSNEVIAFEVLGLAEGFRWPWDADHATQQ